MKINFNKILEIYGVDLLETIKENVEDVTKNINYFNSLGFNDTFDIFERYPYIFIEDNKVFKEKLNKFILKLGYDYVESIENNLELLEDF